MIALARLLVRFSARLVPDDLRARWREEWLGEINAAPATFATLRRAIGAPRDAFNARSARTGDGSAAAFRSDIVHAWRLLVRRPAHTGAIVACLAIGLIASTGTFSVMNSFLYGDLAGIRQRPMLARIYLSYDSAVSMESIGGGRRVSAEPLSLNDFEIMRRLPPGSALTSISAEGTLRMTAAGRREPVSLNGAFASGDFFETLRTAPTAGRLFTADDEKPEAPAVAVVTEHFWRTQLDGRADAIGATILLAGQPFTVIGVTPPRFHGMQPVDIGEGDDAGTQVWVPLKYAAGWPDRPTLDEPWLSTVGRLADGRTRADAELQLAVAAARVGAANPTRRAHATSVVRAHGFGPSDTSFEIFLIILVVLSLPLTVLAIGCANVANLQLARAAERARELAVRLSLGGTRWQLIRLLTLETLASAGAAVGLSLAGLAAIMRYVQPWFPTDLAIDWRVMLFATALAVGIALATGLAPAWLVLRRSTAGQLKQNAQGGGLAHSRLRSSLVVVQVALSLLLLSITGVFLRTVEHMEVTAPRALKEQILATFSPAELRMPPSAARDFADRLAARAAADGRVTGVSLSAEIGARVGKPGEPPAKDLFTRMVEMTPSWLDVMDVKVQTGRALTADDAGNVALISARLAEMLSPGSSPLGMALRIQGDDGTSDVPVDNQTVVRYATRGAAGVGSRVVEVVGVVADNPLRPSVARPAPVIYTVLPPELHTAFTLRVRSTTPDAIAVDLRAMVAAADSRLTWTSLERGDRRYLAEGGEMMQVAAGIGACGIVALILSATGLYAVISYVVMLRRQEIGIRLALGADPWRIVGLVLRQALTLIGVGAVAGLALAIPAAFTMRATFVSRVAIDLVVFAPTVALLLVIGLVAAAVPARRAAAIDPIAALRQD